MAFKPIPKKDDSYDSIESLFRDLNTSEIEALYHHQGIILQHYQDHCIEKKNVAIELPTGSGKTLVGLLIAEFRRRKNKGRILYACPTIQLVNQVVQISNENYGIKCIGFTGSNKKYPDKDKYSYKNGDAIAVTTYSALFNTFPWFEEPELIILDDAHASENYIASLWSLEIQRSTHREIYSALLDTLKENLTHSVYERLSNESTNHLDRGITEKFPNSKLFERKNEIFDVLSSYLDEHEYLKYPWSMINDHLEACQIFITWKEILIRPMIPPSLENKPFKDASQRIFMSATLGDGGDLQRITGIENFDKIPLPKGWDKQGNGRRFFMFPNLNLNTEECDKLVEKLLSFTNRSVILVSSDNEVNNLSEIISSFDDKTEFFTIRDIEKSKEKFITSENAVVAIANRFDGIDFAGDQCRSLFLVAIPYAANLQEKFMQSRMNASLIFNDRNRTRLVQAIGRCTRSPKDYSAICVLGDKDLSEWLVLENKSKYLHPELQAELEFGITQSKDSTIADFVENYQEFMNQSDVWKEAIESIIDSRKSKAQEEFSGSRELGDSAKLEVKFQYALWNKNYEECFDLVIKIIKGLDGGNELSGYRAYWNYQAASICEILHSTLNMPIYRDKRDDFYNKLIKICPTASWLRSITTTVIEDQKYDEKLLVNIEHLQNYLSEIDINRTKKYLEYIREIESYITKNDLENLNLNIGKLLGYKSENIETEGSPDPFWISGDDLIFVFENKFYENADGTIPLKHIRQALTHETWIRKNISQISPEAEIITVFLTNRTSLSQEGQKLVSTMRYWNYDEFLVFSRKIITLARSYQKYYGGANDQNWKEMFIDEHYAMKIGPEQLKNNLEEMSNLQIV